MVGSIAGLAGGLLLASGTSRANVPFVHETVDTTGSVGAYTSLVLDAQGNPRISYRDFTNFGLKYASAAVELASPSPGDIWPVGASRTVTWNGTGRVDLYLSTDGGSSWSPYEIGLTGGEHRLVVPHTPSKFAAFKLERAVPRSVSKTPGLFTIETSVSLLAMLAAPLPEGAKGVEVTWQTDPGPEDLAGYRLERATTGADWRTIVPLTRETSHTDPDGGPGSRYRLFAVNGLGEELWLGEAAIRPLKPLAAWPLPYRGGALTISFATAGGLGGGSGRAELSVYDVTGRLVRRLDSGAYPAGHRIATWDGRDALGREVAAGIYLLRASGDLGYQRTMKLAVLR
jgi:hypothetical protein